MRQIPFLSQEEIYTLQEREAQSDKAQKRTPEQIEAIYSSGQNILVSASTVCMFIPVGFFHVPCG